jgi:heptosyltransferase-2
MPEKILVVNMNYMGDALLTTPALSALRQNCPDAQIETIVGAGTPAEALRGNPDLDRVIERQARGSFARIVELYRLLRQGRYTQVILLPPLPAYAIAAWLARTPARIGQADRGMNLFLTHRLPTNAVHMADAMLDTMPVPAERKAGRRLAVALTEADRDEARRLLAEAGLAGKHPLLAVNVGATRPQKRWFAEAFAEAIDRLAGVTCILIGAGPDDAALAAQVQARTARGRAVSLVDRTGLKSLAALLEQCDALLTADSGPMHLATAVGTPAVALFGSTDPSVTGPYDRESRVISKRLPCSPCGSHPTCRGRYDCMRGIAPEDAALAVREVLRARGPSPVPLPMMREEMPRAAMPLAEAPAVPVGRNAPAVPAGKSAPAALARSAPGILIVTKFRFIGDTLLAIPIFRAARRLWPDARLTLLTGRNARLLLQNNPYLDEIIEFDPNRRDVGPRPFLSLIRRLRRQRFDLCLTLNRSFHSALIAWFAGCGTRAGFRSEGRRFLLNHPVPYEYDGDQSEIACYFDVLRAVAPQVDAQSDLELWISPDEERDAADRLRQTFGAEIARERLIGIQPGASLARKRWPVERYAPLMESIGTADPDARFVLLGGPDERDAGAALLGLLSPETRAKTGDFIGRLDLRGSLALVSKLGLFVGNDTAVMHSAVALHVPTVALFGPTNPRKWGNYGQSHRVLESPTGDLTGIAVPEVIEAVCALRRQERSAIEASPAR